MCAVHQRRKNFMKVIITVSGGNVQSVHSDDDAVQVLVYDEDNLREEGFTASQRANVLTESLDGLNELDVEHIDIELGVES
jgi:hypothetical protein